MSFAARDGTGRRAVVLRDSGKVIGGAGLVWRDLESGREIELGYHLHHDYWGQGYATEAAGACLEQARSLGLRRVVSLIYTDNPRSEAVARRLGMSPRRGDPVGGAAAQHVGDRVRRQAQAPPGAAPPLSGRRSPAGFSPPRRGR